MKITKDTAVEINFVVKGTDGEVYDDTSKHPHAPAYLHGYQQMLAGVEEALEGKKAGDKFTVELAPEKTFGPRNDEMIQKTTIDQFGPDADVKEGLRFQTQGPQGVMIVTVIKVEGPEVTLDLNHPLAGKDLVFDVEVMQVRAATAKEIEHGHIHPPESDCCASGTCES